MRKWLSILSMTLSLKWIRILEVYRNNYSFVRIRQVQENQYNHYPGNNARRWAWLVFQKVSTYLEKIHLSVIISLFRITFIILITLKNHSRYGQFINIKIGCFLTIRQSSTILNFIETHLFKYMCMLLDLGWNRFGIAFVNQW
jgi:hypothetical protein